MGKEIRKGNCVVCGGDQVHETRPFVVSYKGNDRTVPLAGWYCTNCGEGVSTGTEMEPTDRALVELRAIADKVLLPEQVAKVRKKLKISQREASRVLGGGPNAFNRYESGKVPVSEPMQNLLILLGNDPTRLQELRARKARTNAPREIRAKGKRAK